MLSKKQREFLRSSAQELQPLVIVGKHGFTGTLVHALEEVLAAHELVKVKFIDHKDEKPAITADLAARTNSELVTIIGHMAVFYRQHAKPDQRRYILPES